MQLLIDFEQNQQLVRVRGKTAEAIVEFFSGLQSGEEFHADDLRRWVASRVCVAPGSPDRVMRDLRQRGVLNYVLADRANSLYRKV